MAKFEVLNELTLKVTFDNSEYIHSKVGAMIGFQGGLKFEKELLGPGRNVIGQAINQLVRRFSGENLPLMKATPTTQSVGYFANEAQHVVVINLEPGERLAVESESILAFTPSCTYGVMFLATGVVSQKGLATSTLTGPGQAAILVDGNPIVLNGPCVVDPDAMVAFTGRSQPTIGLDLSWKNLLPGQASGETYNMKFNDPSSVVIIQPNERKSGIDIGIDGRGGRPTQQDNNLFRQDGNQILGQVGQAFGGGQQGGQQGGLGGLLGGLLGGNNNGF